MFHVVNPFPNVVLVRRLKQNNSVLNGISDALLPVFNTITLNIECGWEEENQLDATQCFIEHVICSTCFGHIYAHHQELATILLVWHVACNSWLLVVRR